MKLATAVLVLVAACLAVFAGVSQAAVDTYCIAGATVQAGEQSANMDGTPVTAAFLFNYEVANGGIIDVLASESPSLNMVTYEEELSYPDTVTNPDDSTYTYVDVAITAGACTGGSGGAAGTAPPPPPSNVFLCYSVFQTDPGVWAASEAASLIAQGYWSPYAVKGNVTGGTNVGGYHLVCNLAAGQAAGQQFETDDGFVLGADVFKALTGAPGWYPVVP